MKQLRGKEVKKYFKGFSKRPHQITLILENIQYAKNVANMFRTAESAGVEKIFLSGISHSPPFGKGLKKVSRGSESKVKYKKVSSSEDAIFKLKKEGYHIVAIELTDNHILLSNLQDYLKSYSKVCFVAGNEDSGVKKSTLAVCDTAVTIPMYGKNPSLNVNVSVGIVLFSFFF